MKGWHWTALALLGGILVAAIIVVPRFSGGTQRAFAGQADPTPVLVLDMNPTNGSGPCNPIDASRNDTPGGGDYWVAVCLENAPAAPASLEISLQYDDTLNQCVPIGVDCLDSDTDPHCRDANPDANAGTTTFGGVSLGSGWDCTSAGNLGPSCGLDAGGAGIGRAHLSCISTQSPALPVNQPEPIAEIEFAAINGGTDTLSFVGTNTVADQGGTEYIDCANTPGQCIGGTDVKGGNTPTPVNTSTPVPTVGPTSTPVCGFEGLPTCTPTPRAHTPTPTITPSATAAAPSGGGGGGGGGGAPPPPAPSGGGAGAGVTPPNTGDASTGTTWSIALAWIILGAAAISLAGGAVYLRRARTRR